MDVGKKARLSKITFIGNKKFKDSKLRKIIVSEEYKFWKFISGKKYLNEDFVNFDKRLLYNFYKNNGYYNVKIKSSFANYLGGSEFELIFNIDADKKYYFNEMLLDLPSDYDPSNFKKLNDIFVNLKGKVYSLNSINKILKEIDKISLNKQYEFLSSTVIENINDNLIDFDFKIEESEKLYVEKINISGNNVTRESVIRNNLVVDEGDAFNTLQHNKSINNIKSLGFFANVESQIEEGSSDKQKIINISVDEKPTGEISAGAGLSTSGATIGFGVNENNFLGRGIRFGSDVSIAADNVKGSLSINNPNYQGTDKSLGLSVQSTVTDRMNNFGYKSNKTGVSVDSGFEYYDDVYLTRGISTFVETLKTDSKASDSIKKQKGSYFDAYFNYSFNYDKRNQKYQPTDGFRSKFSQKVPLLSDAYTLKNSYDYRVYNEYLKENIASFGFFASTSNSLTGKNIRLSDRLFVPSRKLRGFESGKVGPKEGASYVGGNYIMAFNASTTLPQLFPNSQSTEFSLFLDGANVWGIDYKSPTTNVIEDSKIRSAVGLALDIFSPIGPLSFSLATTLTKGNNDVKEGFRFNLGTTF